LCENTHSELTPSFAGDGFPPKALRLASCFADLACPPRPLRETISRQERKGGAWKWQEPSRSNQAGYCLENLPRIYGVVSEGVPSRDALTCPCRYPTI